MFKGAHLRFPTPLSDQFPARVYSCPLGIYTVCACDDPPRPVFTSLLIFWYQGSPYSVSASLSPLHLLRCRLALAPTHFLVKFRVLVMTLFVPFVRPYCLELLRPSASRSESSKYRCPVRLSNSQDVSLIQRVLIALVLRLIMNDGFSFGSSIACSEYRVSWVNRW